MPGYSGHVRDYQYRVDMGTKTDPSAHKYEDSKKEKPNLMGNSTYVSQYTRNMNKDQIVGHYDQKAKEVLSASMKAQEEAQKRAAQTPEEPRRGMYQSSYSSSFKGWENARAYVAPTSGVAAHQNDRRPQNQVVRGPVGHTLLRSAGLESSYSKDYGATGTNPRSRYNKDIGARTVVEQATAKDLFSGTAKDGTTAAPGYSGFMPSADSNQQARNGEVIPLDAKNNLVNIYRHHMPGFTGYQPQNHQSALGVLKAREARGGTK